MSEFDKRLKAAAERYEENPEGADSPVCSAELERRVENLLTQPDKTGKERTRMKNGNTGRMRPKWTALIAAAAVLVVMTVVAAASPVIRDFLHTRMLTEDGPEKLTEVPEGWIGIYTAEDLDAVRYDLEGNYILMEDLTFDPADFESGGRFEGGWTPIGDEDKPFTGIFNGNGHVIRGLTVNAENDSSAFKTQNYVGLFGYCRLTPSWADSEEQTTVLRGYIKNLGLEGGSVRAVYDRNSTGDRLFVGAAAGYSDYVIGCYAKDFTVEAVVTADMDREEIKTFWTGETAYNVTDYALSIGGVAGGAYLVDSCWTDAHVTVDADPANVPYNYVSGVCGLASACITSYFDGSIDAPAFEDRGVCFIRENDVPRYLTNEVFDEICSRIEITQEGELFIPSLDTTEHTGEWFRNCFAAFYCRKCPGNDQPFREAARDLIAADMDDMDVWILDPDLKPREYARLSGAGD